MSAGDPAPLAPGERAPTVCFARSIDRLRLTLGRKKKGIIIGCADPHGVGVFSGPDKQQLHQSSTD